MPKQLTLRNMPAELQGIHLKLAQAIAQDPRVLTRAEKLAMLSEISGVPEAQISTRYLRALEERFDFQQAVLGFRRSYTDLSRGLIESMLPEAVRVRESALSEMKRRLDENPAGADLRLVPALTDPLLERAWPKKDTSAVAAVAVNITLSPRQAELLGTPQYLVDAERIDPSSDGDSTSDAGIHAQ